MSVISVGTRNDASIDVDICSGDPESDWNINNLNVDEAEYLRDELTEAIERAKRRRAVLDGRTPDQIAAAREVEKLLGEGR